MSFTTFIIPTLGRDTLKRSIESLKIQTDQDFSCIIVFDGIKNNLPYNFLNEKFKVLEIQKCGKELNAFGSNGGLVRNKAFEFINSKWISFLDDDDIVTNDYVEKLKKEDNDKIDLILFRMLTSRITPALNINTIKLNEVGISFSIKNEIIKRFNILFQNSRSEDFEFVKKYVDSGATYKISEFITYKVGRHL